MKDDKSEPLWLSADVANALAGHFAGAGDIVLGGVSIDSRSLVEGDLFFAIKGDRFDGHDFVAAALAKGAALAVVASDKMAMIAADPARLIIVADDVLSAMERLARAARARLNGKVVAVTGSVGKTGTKEMLRLAFAASGVVHASVASFNNHWGVPLTLARTPAPVDFGIYEIGMNHPGEIIPLVDLVRPHVAIITTVEPVHLEFFSSEQEIARAKAEIFSGITAGGHAVLNRDNRHFDLLASLARQAGVDVVTFGEAAASDVRLVSVDLSDNHSVIAAEVFGRPVAYRLGAPGRHLVQNSLAVIAALSLAGADVNKGLAALSSLAAPKGRGARLTVPKDGGFFGLLDESYNANPASMRAAISLLGAAQTGLGGRRIAVLGDMLELGIDSPSLHAALADSLEAARVDLVFACGVHMKTLFDRLPEKMRGKYAATSEGLCDPLLAEVAKGDMLMVKGSLGSRMGPLVDFLVSNHSA